MAEKKTPEIEREIGKSMKKEEGKLIRLKLKDIKPYKNNAKIHTEKQIGKIRDSIISFGYKDLIAVDENNVILEGHGRLRALYMIDITGYKEIQVWQITDFNKSEKKAYRIAHNKLTMSTDFDNDILSGEFNELEDTDNFNDTGFDQKEITEIWDEVNPKEIVEDIIEVGAYERAKNKTSIKLGEIWQLGEHRLMCGDATNKENVDNLMKGVKADMVFTDPPYGLGGYGGRNNMELKGDDGNEETIQKFYDCIPMDVKEIYIWGNYKNLMNNIKQDPRDVIVWKKNNFGLGKGYRGQYELCFYYGEFNGSDSDVWEISKDTKYEHPTQKPIELCARAIKNSQPKTILDIFGGSGSTLISCEQLDRKCYMMELDPVYCQVIIDRWEKFTNKQAIKI